MHRSLAGGLKFKCMDQSRMQDTVINNKQIVWQLEHKSLEGFFASLMVSLTSAVERKDWISVRSTFQLLSSNPCKMGAAGDLFFKFKRYIDTHAQDKKYGRKMDVLEIFHLVPFSIRNEIYKDAKKQHFGMDDLATASPKKMHIICDIDDTILKTIQLKNRDQSMRIHGWKGTFYPYLATCLHKFITLSDTSSGFVTFSTNRAEYLSEYTAAQIREKFDSFHIICADNFTFMYYSLMVLLQQSPIPLTQEWFDFYYLSALCKFNKICKFMILYEELDFVFIGDSGEGDLITGIMLLFQQNVRQVFIHDTKKADGSTYIIRDIDYFFQNERMSFSFRRRKDKLLNICATIGSATIKGKTIQLFDNFSYSSVCGIFHTLALPKANF